MKVTIRIDKDASDEVIIQCRSLTDEVLRIQKLLEEQSEKEKEIELTLDGKSYFAPVSAILFFETVDGHTYAHTRNKMYRTQLKLYEILNLFPEIFVRVSKSCVLNTKTVSSIKKSVTGICEVFFNGCDKKVFVSRMYYKPFREIITERHGLNYEKK